MLQAAAAAARHVGAGRDDPVGAGAQHLHQVGLGEAAARLGHPRADSVAGGRVAAEDHEAVAAGDGRPAEGEVADLELQDVVAAGALHAPSIAPWPAPPPTWRSTGAASRSSCGAPGPAAEERLAHLFAPEAVAGLRAQGARALARFAAEGLLRRASADEMAEIRARLAEPVVEGPGGLLAPGRGRRRPGRRARPRAPASPAGGAPAGDREPAGPAAGGGARAARGGRPRGRRALARDAPGRRRRHRPRPRRRRRGGAARRHRRRGGRGRWGAPARTRWATRQLEAADLPRLVRAPQLADEVSTGRAADVAARTLELLELDLPGGPPAAPAGREGLARWLETLAALGAALAAAGASPRLPVERRRLADPALARASGLLLEGLAADPAVARARRGRARRRRRRAGGRRRPPAGRPRRRRARRGGRRARRGGAHVAGGRRGLARRPEPGRRARRPGPRRRAARPGAGGRPARAPARGPRLRWFADPAAGRFLRELWLEGGALDAEGLARELGAPGLDPGPLAAELAAP